jgi:hypothetical protein
LSRHLAVLDGKANSETTQNNQSLIDEQNHQAQKLRSKLPRIQPVSIPSLGETLATILYPAVDNPVGSGVEYKNHTVVFCNAYGHENTRAARNLQQLAIQLSQTGFNVIRFDYAGTGNSTGKAALASLNTWRSNIASIVDYARTAVDSSSSSLGSVSLLGIRLGASLLATTPLKDIEHVILWDPVIDGDRYMEMLRSYHHYELSSLTRYLSHRRGQPHQFLGYEYSATLQESLSSISLWNQTKIESRICSLISSHGNPEFEKKEFVPSAWEHRSCSDEIFWDKGDFTGRAFSSPQIAQSIQSILTRGTK